MVLSRAQKQILIAVIFLLIVAGMVALGYAVFVPAKPKPTPNPTANLAVPEVMDLKLLNIQGNDYDLVARVRNPNLDYGADDVEYRLDFFDASGSRFSTKTDSFYILPGQTKYLIESPLSFGQPVARVELHVTSIDWQKMDLTTASQFQLVPQNVVFTPVNQQGIYARVDGNVSNSSNFDLDGVDVVIIVSDPTGAVIAVNKTKILTFLSQTQRGFEVSWPAAFVGQYGSVTAQAYSNVFDNANFLRRYGTPQRFQQFY